MNTQNIFYLFEEISPFKKRGKISTEYFNFFLKILSSTQIVGISPVKFSVFFHIVKKLM